MPADGWCLVRSVATVLEKSPEELLKEALLHLLSVLHLLHLTNVLPWQAPATKFLVRDLVCR
jgi:hypothetical protein